MQEPTHSVLAPSDSPVWVHCAGHVQMEQASPTPGETDESREGTAAHWVGGEWALHAKQGKTFGRPEVAPNGIPITDEMWIAAGRYVARLLDTNVDLSFLNIESRVDMLDIHELCWGTPDAYTVDYANCTITVDDYKWGHSAVDARANWQCLCYLAGVMALVLKNPHESDEKWTCIIRITQPRAYHPMGTVRTWTLSGGELRGYINQLNAAATAAMSDNPTCTSGLWCKNCQAWSCPTRASAVTSVFEFVGSLDLTTVPPEHLGTVYRITKLADTLVSSQLKVLGAQMEAMLAAGTPIHGYTFTTGQPKALAWNEGVTEGEILLHAAAVGIDVQKPASLITPTQAKTKGLDIETLASRPPASRRLTAVEDTKAFYLFNN